MVALSSIASNVMALTFHLYMCLRPGVDELLFDLVDRLLNDSCQLCSTESKVTVSLVSKRICMMVEQLCLSGSSRDERMNSQK